MLGTALCHTFPQLMAVRFLLGFFEGTAMPWFVSKTDVQLDLNNIMMVV